jgi:hypothetical protein
MSMPRIKSTLTGEVSNVRGDIARELIKMGVATAIDPLELADMPAPGKPKYKAAAPPEPSWDVTTIKRATRGNDGGEYPELVIRMEIIGQVYNWSGQPKYANAVARWDGGQRYLSGFGRPVPDEVLARYEHLWKKNPQWRGPYGETKEETSANTKNYFRGTWINDELL